MKILLTGANGQVGNAMQVLDKMYDHALIALSHHDCDITNANEVLQKVDQYQPNIIVNCAAYTAVDKAESEIQPCMSTNAEGPLNLARAANELDIPLIQLSTDYVFDGNTTEPYTEDSNTHPINTYGQSKLAGELSVKQHCTKYIILRLSGVISHTNTNFIKTMLTLARKRKELNIIDDQFTCPTSANDIANCVYTIIDTLNKQRDVWGIYHYTSQPITSWYAFAKAIFQEADIEDLSINAITSEEYKTAAIRPKYSVLNCDKIQTVFDIQQPDWRESIRPIIKQLQERTNVA